ncbi:hypothetical protein TNCV_1097791 [Trichonephila clavipes]|nr:hypothetical protein TNCV_1097791 [Trichonephila clavipes]
MRKHVHNITVDTLSSNVVVVVHFILGYIRKTREKKHNKITEEYRVFITNDDDDLSIENKDCAAFHLRRESISGESPTSFPEDTSIPYPGFEPEFIGFQVSDRLSPRNIE